MTGPTATWKVTFGPQRRRRPALVTAGPPQTDADTEADATPAARAEQASSSPAAGRRAKPPSMALASSLARRLALAHHIERLVADGTLANYADAARRLGVSRARLSQILDLLLLSPELQARVLAGDIQTSERAIRSVARVPHWCDQQAVGLSSARAQRDGHGNGQGDGPGNEEP